MTISDDLIQHVTGEAHHRQTRFAQARQAYDAEMQPPLINDDGTENTLDNIIIPAARTIIDGGVDFLFGSGVTFDVTEAYGDDAQKYLTRLWRENRMPTKLIELALHGGITGAFVFKFEPDANDVREGKHRFVVADPSYLDVVWDPHDTETVLLYRFEYPTIEKNAKGEWKPFAYRQDIEAVRSEPDLYGHRQITSWTITNSRAEAPTEYGVSKRKWFATRTLTAKWEVVGEHEWPHEWAPVFAGQNLVSPNSWWGYSDIDGGVCALNDALNRVASNLAKTVRHHGHPTEVVYGGSLPEDHAIGEPIEFDDGPEDVKVEILETHAAALTASLEFLSEIRAHVYEAGNSPDVSRGKVDNVGQLSGAAMRIMYGPRLGMNTKKRLTYGDALVAAIRAALDYAGFAPLGGDDGAIELVWGDPLPKNEKEDAEVAEIDSRLGFSRRSLITRRGGDPDQEDENRVEEGAQDPGMRGVLDLIPSTPDGEGEADAADDDQ